MMKKTLSWILALMIIVSTISCIGVVASADAGGIKSFTVRLAKDGTVLPADQKFEVDYNSEESYFNQCSAALWSEGTEITLNYSDGTTSTYAFNGEGAFVSGGGGLLDSIFGSSGDEFASRNVFIDEISIYGKNDDHFVVCLTNGLRYDVPVKVVNHPGKTPVGINYIPVEPIKITENCCGYKLNDMFIYTPDSIFNVDDCLELFYYGKDNSVKYYFCGDGWCDENGNEMPGEFAINEADSIAEQINAGGWSKGSVNLMPVTYTYDGQEVSTVVNVDIKESIYSSVEYVAEEPVVVYENSCGYYGDDENYVYDEELCLVIPGNKIVVTLKEGGEETFYYDDLGNLIDEYDTIVETAHLTYTSSQATTPWVVGSDNKAVIRIFGVETTVDVTIIENPIESIDFASEDVLRLVEGEDGESFTTASGEKAFRYDCSNLILTEGNQITVNYKDSTSVTYTCIGEDYASDNGDILGVRFLEVVTDQDIYGTEWFANKIYYATLIYKGVSTEVPVKVIPADVPETPVVKLNNGEFGVIVKWDKIDSAESYVVYRRVSGTSKWSRIGYADTNKFVDVTAVNNTKYDYTVRAQNDQGLSTYKKVSITYLAAPQITEVVNLAKGVRVQWDAVKGATSYRVYRKAAGDTSWKYLTETKDLLFIDKSIVNATGGEYIYTVRGMKNKIYGAYNTTGESIIRIAKPYVKSAEKADGGVLVQWKATSGAEEYYVYRKNLNAKNPVWKEIGTVVGKNNTSFLDTTADMTGLYRYTVRACLKGTMSSFMLGPIYGAPDTPVLKKIANTYDGVKLTWEASKRADTYSVYRRVKGGGWQLIAKNVTDTTYLDKDAPNGKYVFYTVRAVNEVGRSGYDTKGLYRYFVEAPVLKSAAYTEDDGVTFKWNKVSGAEEYRVYRRTAAGSWRLLDTTTKTTFVDGGVKQNSYYAYTVIAVRNNWYSGYNTKGIAVDTVEEAENF